MTSSYKDTLTYFILFIFTGAYGHSASSPPSCLLLCCPEQAYLLQFSHDCSSLSCSAAFNLSSFLLGVSISVPVWKYHWGAVLVLLPSQVVQHCQVVLGPSLPVLCELGCPISVPFSRYHLGATQSCPTAISEGSA